MKKYIHGINGKASYSVLRTYDVLRTLIIVFCVVFTSVNAFADGWTPTDGGLVVNLKPTDQILLSVPVDTTGDGVVDVEFFVENYARFSGGYFKYNEKDTNKYFLRLVPWRIQSR